LRTGSDHIRIESYGTVDELNSYIGYVIKEMNVHYKDILAEIQDRLYLLLAPFCLTPQEKK
jgi:cob(I)alamin adenosyltransferase